MATWTAPAAAPPVVPATRQIASLWKRGLAVLLDTCVVLGLAAIPLGVIWLVSGEPFSFETGFFSTPSKDATTGELARKVLEALVVLVVWSLYTGLLTSRSGEWRGQTVGKRVTELRITHPDGRELAAGDAWKRVGLQALLLGGTSTLGAIIDLVTGSPPTGTLIAGGVGCVLFVITLAPVLRGQQRQTLYDRFAGTVVVLEPKALPQVSFVPPAGSAPGEPQPASAYTPVFTQTPSTPAGPLPGDGSDAAAITPRPVRGKTWALVVSLGLLMLVGAGTLPLAGDFAESLERADKIRDEPENKAAFAKLKRLEKLGETCLKTGRSPDDCDEPAELGATDLEFVDGFDLRGDPIGSNAGKVAAVAHGDDVVFYAFTSADRTWSTIAGGGWLDRVCLDHTEDLCKDTPDW